MLDFILNWTTGKSFFFSKEVTEKILLEEIKSKQQAVAPWV